MKSLTKHENQKSTKCRRESDIDLNTNNCVSVKVIDRILSVELKQLKFDSLCVVLKMQFDDIIKWAGHPWGKGFLITTKDLHFSLADTLMF